MMNAKVKVPNNTGKKNTGLPMANQAMKVTGSNSQGVGLIPASAQASGANLQHPSHAKKLTEGKITTGKAVQG